MTFNLISIQLTNYKKVAMMFLKKFSMGASFAGCLLASLNASAATQVDIGKLSLNIYGQVNRGVLATDDGHDTKSYFVDGDTSSTRVGVEGKGVVNESLKAGIHFETEYQSNSAAEVSQIEESDDPGFNVRIAEVFLESDWGRLGLGQGPGAAKNSTVVDLSGTMVAHFAQIPTVGGGIMFREKNGDYGPHIGQTLNALDYEGRYDRLRYDYKITDNVNLAASYGTNDDDSGVTELSAVFLKEAEAGTWRAGLGYSSDDRTNDFDDGNGGYEHENLGNQDTLGASLAYLDNSGLNASVTVSKQTGDSNLDSLFYYTKLGYRTGNHSFSVDYARGEEFLDKNGVSQEYGVAYVYKPIKWFEMYGTLLQHRYETENVDYDNINMLMIGSRVKF